MFRKNGNPLVAFSTRWLLTEVILLQVIKMSVISYEYSEKGKTYLAHDNYNLYKKTHTAK